MQSNNPYQTPSADHDRPATNGSGLARLRRVFGSLFRMAGGFLIAFPFVPVAFDAFHSRMEDYQSDLPAILTAFICFFLVGGTLIFVGNLLTPKMDANALRERSQT